MRILELQGSPREMGRAFGETCSAEIREFYDIRLNNAVTQAFQYGGRRVTEEQALEVARASVGPTRAFDPDGLEELAGIAEGCGLTVEHILLLNGLTDLRDVLAWGGELEAFGGCSAFMAQGDVTADGQLLMGQTWDLATDNMPFVIGVHRRPDRGPETWSMTTVGCLSLIGINEHGVSVGTTNLRCTDARPGVVYLSLIHRALGCEEAAEAVALITAAHRAGAHFYMVGDRGGRAAAVECTATQADVQWLDQGVYVHCNHCLVPSNEALQGADPNSSTLYRTSRMRELLLADAGRLDTDRVRACFSDTSGGDDAICRDDTQGISSNGAVIMQPVSGAATACHGLPSTARWVPLKASTSRD